MSETSGKYTFIETGSWNDITGPVRSVETTFFFEMITICLTTSHRACQAQGVSDSESVHEIRDF